MAIWTYDDSGTLYYYGTDTGIIASVTAGEGEEQATTYKINDSDSDSWLFSIAGLNEVSVIELTASGNSVTNNKVSVDASNNVTIDKDAIDSSTEITVTLNSDTCKNFTFNNSESDDVAVNVKFALSGSFTETFSGLNITTGSKADTVKVDGEKFSDVTINSGAGDDEINVSVTDTANITAGAGADSVTVNAATAEIDTSAENDDSADYIEVSVSSSAKVTTGAGDDTVKVEGESTNVTIETGEGDDSIVVGSETSVASAEITAGAGKNRIELNGGTVTLTATSDGSDTVILKAATTLTTGNGNDTITITEDAANSSIDASEGGNKYIEINAAATVNLGGGENHITLNAADISISLDESSTNTFVIQATANEASIDVSKGSNIIDLSGDSAVEVTISGFNGNDTIKTAENAVIATDGYTVDSNFSVSIGDVTINLGKINLDYLDTIYIQKGDTTATKLGDLINDEGWYVNENALYFGRELAGTAEAYFVISGDGIIIDNSDTFISDCYIAASGDNNASVIIDATKSFFNATQNAAFTIENKGGFDVTLETNSDYRESEQSCTVETQQVVYTTKGSLSGYSVESSGNTYTYTYKDATAESTAPDTVTIDGFSGLNSDNDKSIFDDVTIESGVVTLTADRKSVV